jgi:preprotein translocase subunit SecE
LRGEKKMLKTMLKRVSLVTLAVVLMLSMFSVAVFAEETDSVLSYDTSIAKGVDIDVAPEADASEDATEATDENTEDVTVEEKEEVEKAESATESIGTTGKAEKEGFKLDTTDIVSLVIFGIVVIVLAVYCIVKREKVGKFFRSLKSEFKKIVWSPWNQVRKNTIVVLVVVISIAVLIGVLDLIFNQAIIALGRLF